MADVRVMDEEWGNSGYEVAFDFTKAQRGTVLGAYGGPKGDVNIGSFFMLWAYI